MSLSTVSTPVCGQKWVPTSWVCFTPIVCLVLSFSAAKVSTVGGINHAGGRTFDHSVSQPSAESPAEFSHELTQTLTRYYTREFAESFLKNVMSDLRSSYLQSNIKDNWEKKDSCHLATVCNPIKITADIPVRRKKAL